MHGKPDDRDDTDPPGEEMPDTDGGTGGRREAARLADLLLARDATVATAESLTGGLVGAALTAAAGSSTFYRGGVIAYATELKHALLGVGQELLDRHGAVSAACAEAMAAGVRERTEATFGLSTTGVAGPDTQEGRPVGTVFVGIATATGSRSVELDLPGDREAIRKGSVRSALSALCDQIEAAGPRSAGEDSALG